MVVADLVYRNRYWFIDLHNRFRTNFDPSHGIHDDCRYAGLSVRDPVRIGIVGTAGRTPDEQKVLSAELYNRAFLDLINWIQQFNNEPVTLVSGGAAWADHLAIPTLEWRLQNSKAPTQLELHFPAHLTMSGFIGSRDAGTANHYHELFSQKVYGDPAKTLLSLHTHTKHPQIKWWRYDGFKARNTAVANPLDWLVVVHFMPGQARTQTISCPVTIPAPPFRAGGTVDTWYKSKAPSRYLINLS